MTKLRLIYKYVGAIKNYGKVWLEEVNYAWPRTKKKELTYYWLFGNTISLVVEYVFLTNK